MPCSDKHFIPVLDELDQRAKEAEAAAAKRQRHGGPRPNSGPPKGNLNALKHGRFSRRHKALLEALLDVPEARQALIDIGARNRRRQKKAELEAAYLLMAWLATNDPGFIPAALDRAGLNVMAEIDENDQAKNDQLNAALANMKEAFRRKLL